MEFLLVRGPGQTHHAMLNLVEGHEAMSYRAYMSLEHRGGWSVRPPHHRRAHRATSMYFAATARILGEGGRGGGQNDRTFAEAGPLLGRRVKS